MSDSIYRERFALTLAHQPVDRCPIDLGGTPQSTVDDPGVIRKIAAYYGFDESVPSDYDKFDSRILEHLDVDFRRVGNLVPFVTKYNRKISDTEIIDCFGIRSCLTNIGWQITDGPLHNSTIDDLAAYQFPTLEQMQVDELDSWERKAQAFYNGTPYVIVGEHPVLGVLELACWLCGYEHIMLMCALDPDFIHLLFNKILDFQKMTIKEYYKRIGPYIHLTTSGDDFGTQKGLFMSAQMWREFVKPYMRERIDLTSKLTDAVYMHHSCGGIYDIIPDLIEIGVRILNPIQPAAVGMNPERLKAEFGNKVVFHGGLDTQEVLPSNDTSTIESAVRYLLETMHPWDDGGYIFAPAHNLQTDVYASAVSDMYSSAQRILSQH